MVSIKFLVVTCLCLFFVGRGFGASYGLRDPDERRTQNRLTEESRMPLTYKFSKPLKRMSDSEQRQTRNSLADDSRVYLTGARNAGRERIGGREVRRGRQRRAACCPPRYCYDGSCCYSCHRHGRAFTS